MSCATETGFGRFNAEREQTIRDSRTQEISGLFAAIKRNPIAGCDHLVDDAIATGHFTNGALYAELTVLKALKGSACICKRTLVQRSQVPPVLGTALPGQTLESLFAIANSYDQPPEVEAAVSRLLKERVLSAEQDEIANLLSTAKQNGMPLSEAFPANHPRHYASYAEWEPPLCRFPDVYNYNFFNEPPRRLIFHDIQGVSYQTAYDSDRTIASAILARKETLERAAREERAQARERLKAEALAQAKQTPEYWSSQITERVWHLTAAVNRASELVRNGYATLAHDQAWPQARVAEQALCSVVAEMNGVAPEIGTAALDLLVKNIAYQHGDREAASARILLVPYLRGECNLLGK
jgi:hypothetical protein